MGKHTSRRSVKSGSYGDCEIDYSDKEYKITLEAFIKLLKLIAKNSDILIIHCGESANHIFISIEDGDGKGGCFYDFGTKSIFSSTQNWADLIEELTETSKNDLFSEAEYHKDKKDLDILAEEDWKGYLG